MEQIDSEKASYELTEITVRGAREHNLKNINLKIPRDKFVVITGPSGSGKSSLAFDTLYAEGQRRYVEVLSPYAKQFLGVMKKPDVDVIEGLSPAISIEQKSISTNPRSTVGTVTEIYDYMRLLFSKIGIQYCTDCNVPVLKRTTDEIIDYVENKYLNKTIIILAPLIKGRKGHFTDLFDYLVRKGFTRARIDGEIKQLKTDLKLSRYNTHDIELVIDRFTLFEDTSKRLREAVELALTRGKGSMSVIIDVPQKINEVELFSINNTCPSCGVAYEPTAPNMFSFNSNYGACPACEGLGEVKTFDIDLMVPDKTRTLEEGAILPLGKYQNNWNWSQLRSFATIQNIPLNKPFKNLTLEQIHLLFYGIDESEIELEYKMSNSRNISYKLKYIGLMKTLNNMLENPPTISVKKMLSEFLTPTNCPECDGGRLKKESLAVKIYDYSIKDLAGYDIKQAQKEFIKIRKQLTERESKISFLIFKEIESRLEFLLNVGLSYVSLSRSVKSLSGGESQRIRLASQIGSKLVGIMYVLDEPSIGLHQHDNNRLINSLKKLRDLGNTVIVVEHDKAMIEQSDLFIDIGPGAGVHGGEVIISSSVKELKKLSKEEINNSFTAQYMLKKREIEIPEIRRKGNGNFLSLYGCTGNNLKNVDIDIPLGTFVCVTGMSGSGKSTIINDTLYPILSNKLNYSYKSPLAYKSVVGLEFVDKVIEIDQSPIGRTPRSNPATYSGMFTMIRDFYALLPESKVRGYKAGRFSFNVKEGRCEECEGAGIKKIEMNFLPDVYVTCDVCDGKRYNNETLTVTYKNKSIADVLDFTCEEALEFFSENPRLKKKIQVFNDVGLGYIKIGQQAPTLSGGEAQRVKLATELSKLGTGKTVYLLDEPTTGLHFEDIKILLKLLYKLVDKGNTVIVIEHNLDVIKCADWVFDLGPEGGEGGGKLVAKGTPEDIVKVKASLTGKYLKHELK